MKFLLKSQKGYLDIRLSIAWIAISVMLSGCTSHLQLPDWPRQQSTAPVSTAPKGKINKAPSPDLIQNFEREIAKKLLANIEEIPYPRSASISSELIESRDALLNQSGIDPSLVDSSQREQIHQHKYELQLLEYEQTHWLRFNHLNPLYSGILENETRLKKTETETVVANLTLQSRSGVHYPALLQERSNEFLIGTDTSGLFKTTQDEKLRDWFSRKLSPLVSIAELRNFSNTAAVTGMQKHRQLYANPHYDIQQESEPEQLTLDILSLHLQESPLQRTLDIRGFEQSLFEPVKVLQSDNETTRLLVSLGEVMRYPAFEFQTLAYQTAGEVNAKTYWPRNWQRTLALALGQINSEFLFHQGLYDEREARIGYDVRRALFQSLALIECNMALGRWDLQQAKQYLFNNSPYSQQQIESLLVQLLAEDGSYAAAAIAITAAKTLNTGAPSVPMWAEIPQDLDAFIAFLNEAADPKDS